MTYFLVKFPEDVAEKIKKDAKDKGLSYSSYIRMLVIEKLKNQ